MYFTCSMSNFLTQMACYIASKMHHHSSDAAFHHNKHLFVSPEPFMYATLMYLILGNVYMSTTAKCTMS